MFYRKQSLDAPEHSERNVVNTATTNMYRGHNYTANGAGEERDHRLPTLQKAMGIEIRQRLQFTVKLSQFFDTTIGSKSYTICTMHVKNIFPTD